jgi:hypothetical protein
MTQGMKQALLLTLLAALAGCGTVLVQPQPGLPPPLVEKLPAVVAIYYPAEFREFTHKEKRYQADYEVLLGPAHVANLTRLLQGMFARVVEVDDPARAREVDPDVAMVLEPRFEDYAFLSPRDMAGDFFTVTIRYRLNVYNPRGERVDGYVFTGYGRQKAGAMSSTEPLARATQRAMRDAGAKLAVELPVQDTVKRLLAGDVVKPGPDREQEVEAALGSFGGAAATPPPASGEAAPGAPAEAGPPADAAVAAPATDGTAPALPAPEPAVTPGPAPAPPADGG